MATHSTAYIPTNRKPGEYLMSEGWSDGMLNATGIEWYKSVPRMDEAIRATLMLGGSPVFAPAGETTFDIKEIDYIEEGVADIIDDDDTFVASVGTTLEALEAGNIDEAQATAYGQMSLEEKMSKDITLNTSLHTIANFSDIPVYDKPHTAFDLQTLIGSVKQYDPTQAYNSQKQVYKPYMSTEYFYDSTHAQWWGVVMLTDETWMWLPLVVAFAIEGKDTYEDVKELHKSYPEHYAKDIEDLACFNEALNAALTAPQKT